MNKVKAAKLKEVYNDLQGVLCDPSGEPSIDGSVGDMQVIRAALRQLQQVITELEYN